MDFILAYSRYKRRRLPQAMAICDQLLARNSGDEAAWMLKCCCLIKQNDFDPLETEQVGIEDQLLAEKAVNTLANPGTSFKSPQNQVLTARLRTGLQAPTSRANNGMLRTGIAATANGRVLRLSTASLQQFGKDFLDVGKMDLRRVAQRKSKARVIFLYLFHVQHNIRKALQLAVHATELNNYTDPWWKLSLGKCYYHLGLLSEAQRQLRSSLKHNCNIESYLYLSKLYAKQDSVVKSISTLQQGLAAHPNQPMLNIAMGRIYDRLQSVELAHEQYKEAITKENCNVEAVGNFAAHFYYKDQAEVAARLYQRLVELGYSSVELWNNLGLCTHALNQFHLFYNCFERAIVKSREQGIDEVVAADVWYNLGCIYVSGGEVEMGMEAFFAALGHVAEHASALNNVGVLYARMKKIQTAINYCEKSYREDGNFQAAYNLSVWYMQTQQLQKSWQYNGIVLNIYPMHEESKEIRKILLKKVN